MVCRTRNPSVSDSDRVGRAGLPWISRCWWAGMRSFEEWQDCRPCGEALT